MLTTKAIADPKEIRRGLTLLHPKSDIVELRAINNNTSYNATGYFTNFELYITEAVRLNSQGFTIYSIVNELNPNLLNLASNKIAPGLKNTAKDKHVIRRRCLPIDIDPEREPKDISSTDMEHQSALEMMYKISRWLPTFGIPEESIALADSGNGGHLLLPIDLPNDEQSKALIEKCLKAVKQKFSTAEMIVDTSICNAARIWKTYGTVSRKGDDTTERPHRLASILRMPTIWKPIEVGILNKIAALAPNEPPANTTTQNRSRGDGQQFDLESWFDKFGIVITKKESYEGGYRYILDHCGFNPSHNGSSAAVIVRPDGLLGYSCLHEECQDKHWRDFRELYEPDYRERRERYQENHNNGHKLINTNLNDTANAEYLANLYGSTLRYDHRRARWLKWSGHRWQPDNNGEIYRFAIASARDRYRSASNITDLKERERVANWSIGSENRSRLESTIAIAKNLQPISDTGEHWDNNPWLLGVLNGVVDLKTGLLRDGKPEDNITMSTCVKFDPGAQCPLWLNTLSVIFESNEELIDWLWRYWGYSITGLIKEQSVIIGHGFGGNGKGVVTGAIRKTMGDYAYDAPFSTLEMHSRASIPNDIAALEHKRIVTSSETNDGTRLNEARLKAISHGDPVTARYLHAEFFTYEPECKIFLFVNHKPRVKDDSFGFWRGVRLVPFLRRFDGEADDKDLSKKLEAEKPGILNWIVQGCLEYQRRGLSPIPAKVSNATTEYKRESDELADFIESPEVIEEDGIVGKASELYGAYTDWAEKSNLKKSEILSSVNFGKAMKGKYRWEHKNTGNIFYGIGLVKGFVKGFESNELKNNVLPAIESPTRENIEKPSLPFTPSLKTEKELPDCQACGRNEWEYTADGKLKCSCGYVSEVEDENG